MDNYKSIDTYEEYQTKMKDFIAHVKLMVGEKGKPCPINCIIVSGEKGVGKSFQVEKTLESLKDIRPYLIYKGEISPVEMYKLMWQHNDSIIVLDDVNGIITDKNQGSSLLKAACEDKVRRRLFWKKQNPNCVHVDQDNPLDNEEVALKMKRRVDAIGSKKLVAKLANEELFPDTFFFTGAIIILTNKPLSVIDKASEKALANRSWHQEMLFSVDGAIDLIKNIGSMLVGYKDQDSLEQDPLTQESVDNAVKFLTTEDHIKFYKKFDHIPTFRTLKRVAREFQYKVTEITDDTILNNTESRVYSR